jgi:bifunctional non-homologous end joining protein LigD
VLQAHQFPRQVVMRARKPFDGDQWLFEIKHDGFRAVAIKDVGSTRLFTRNGYDISRRHQPLIHCLNVLPARRLVIDGELVVLDDDGRSNFARLMFGRTGTHYFAFDLLLLDGTDLRAQSLETRKSLLQELLGDRDPVRYCDHVIGTGKAFFDLVRDAGLEGMVAKRRQSQYLGQETDDWLKVKCLRVHQFVVDGWIPASGRSRGISALLLGEFISGRLHYVGKVDSGFDWVTLREIREALVPCSDSPFQETVTEPNAIFSKPNLRVPIEFVDFTDTGMLRRPVFSRIALF